MKETGSNRIKDKVDEIEKYLKELEEIKIDDFEQYKIDFKSKALYERYFEKIVEAIVDLAFLIIKEEKLKIPEEDKDAFDILAQKEIINQELAERLKNAKGMRNIIAHEYGKLNDKLVFDAVNEEIERDAEEFIESIRGER